MEQEYQKFAEDYMTISCIRKQNADGLIVGDFNARIGPPQASDLHQIIGGNTERVTDEQGETMSPLLRPYSVQKKHSKTNKGIGKRNFREPR